MTLNRSSNSAWRCCWGRWSWADGCKWEPFLPHFEKESDDGSSLLKTTNIVTILFGPMLTWIMWLKYKSLNADFKILDLTPWGQELITGVYGWPTFRDEEMCRVERRFNGWERVHHTGFFNPFKRAFLWMPLNGVERVSICYST